MGREIRRVPKDWEHPKNDRGEYQPLYDQDYESAAREWWARATAWNSGDLDAWLRVDSWPREKSEFDKYRAEHPWFWDWHGRPPNAEYYRPDFGDPATCYQMYETVSEGTPVSPVFETLGELAEWLVSQGYSEDAAAKFCETGWAPSMMLCEGKLAMNVGMYEPGFCKKDADS